MDGYQTAFGLMLDTHKIHNRTLKGNVMCVNCTDAAFHTTKKDAESNIINFSAQTWGDSIKQHFTTSNSLNIIMFLEINTDKQLDYVRGEFVGICCDIDKMIKTQKEKDDDTDFFLRDA